MDARTSSSVEQRDTFSWAVVDHELEIRSRLASIIDALDVDDRDTALINSEWLLKDLDDLLDELRDAA